MKIVKVHSLNKGWCDRDALILHASFQILTDFVEKEDPFNHSPHWAKGKKGKMTKELYDWWKKRKNKNYKTFEEEDKQDREDEKMLKKLAYVRLTLWT